MEKHERKIIESIVVEQLGSDLYKAIFKQIHDAEYSPILSSAMDELRHNQNPYAQVKMLAAYLLQADKLLQEYQKRVLAGLQLSPQPMIMCMDCPNREQIESNLSNAQKPVKV